MYVLAWQLTYMALAAWCGFAIARRWKSPASTRTWILVIAGLLISPAIGVTTYIVLINDVGILLNRTLIALFVGILLCMILRQDARSARLSAVA